MYPYNNNYNQQFYMQDLQAMKDRIDKTMQQYQQSQVQNPPVQPQIHQSFQLAPQGNFSEIQAKYVSDIEDVKNTFIMNVGLFVNKEMNTLWLKNINGDIRIFALNEIIEQDPKDKEILMLKREIEEMKGMINNANKSDVNNSNINGELENEKPPKLSNSKRTNAK